MNGLRIRWRLCRDFDADLMRYRGWSVEDLEDELFALRFQRALDPETVRRAFEALQRATADFEASWEQIARDWQRAGRQITEAFANLASGETK